MAGHTEKEAAELWCPHARGDFSKVGDVAVNQGNRDGRCIGSRCSQWRWLDDETAYWPISIFPEEQIGWQEALERIKKDEVFVKLTGLGWSMRDDAIPCPPGFSGTGGWTLKLSKPRGESRRGFCGLAGRP